jgi:site-specific DNA-cytosine methylase
MVVAARMVAFGEYSVDGTASAMKARDYKDATDLVAGALAVRRLTPTECERLQGFPDNYTNIKNNCPDAPRYKVLGNSWAVPNVRWIGERIAKVA